VNLPNQQQVKNIVGHVGTAVGTAIAIFGLQAKGLDPVKVTAAINALGDLVNNIVIVAGLIGGVLATYKAASGSSTASVTQQSAQAIISNPVAVAAALSAETKTELAAATVAIAANSEAANKALLENVTQLPNVQGVVVDKNTAASTQNPLVTANPRDIPAAL
jgi:hypothetical protein